MSKAKHWGAAGGRSSSSEYAATVDVHHGVRPRLVVRKGGPEGWATRIGIYTKLTQCKPALAYIASDFGTFHARQGLRARAQLPNRAVSSNSTACGAFACLAVLAAHYLGEVSHGFRWFALGWAGSTCFLRACSK